MYISAKNYIPKQALPKGCKKPAWSICTLNNIVKTKPVSVYQIEVQYLKGLNHEQLSFSTLKRHDSWPLCQGSFPLKLKNKNKKHIFLKILEIVCVSELGTWKEKCISGMGTGKEIGSQIWGPEKKLVLKSGDRKDFFRA